MTQPGDIALDGVDYMVMPGTYQRQSDGVREGAAQRITISDFVGGQRRALYLEADRSWDSEGVMPCYGGQGVEPAPLTEPFTDAVIGVPSTTTRAITILAGNRLYLGLGRYLYRSDTTVSVAWSAWTQIADMGVGAIITGLAPFGGDRIGVALGTTAEIKTVLRDSPYTIAVFSAGEKGRHVQVFESRLIYSKVSTIDLPSIRMNTGGGIGELNLDTPVRAMALHAGKLAIATDRSLYLLDGRGKGVDSTWTQDPQPIHNQGEVAQPTDYTFLISHGGKLYTWLAQGVAEWNPNTGSNRQGWRPSGVEGIACYGATVAAGWLIVSLRTHTLEHQVWGFDGNGWWLIESGVRRIWPTATAGVGEFDVLWFRDGSTTYDLTRLIYRSTTRSNLRNIGGWRSSLLHAGEPAAKKAWAGIRASFAVPEDRGNSASLDSVTLTVRYSIDCGKTWTQHVTDSWLYSDGRDRQLGGSITNPPESSFLQVEVEWSSVSDWAPVLTGLYIDYQLIDIQSRRRRWTLAVAAKDSTVLRSGSVDPSTGRQIRAELWAKWQAGSTITLRDVDYDVDLTERSVRIVGLQEKIDRPADEQTWGNSPIALTMVEV